VASRTLS